MQGHYFGKLYSRIEPDGWPGRVALLQTRGQELRETPRHLVKMPCVYREHVRSVAVAAAMDDEQLGGVVDGVVDRVRGVPPKPKAS